jgi:hypothetical protein
MVRRISGMLSVSTSSHVSHGRVNKNTESTFKANLEDYLATVDDSKIRTLEDLVEFNKKQADQELTSSKLPLKLYN